MSNKRLIDGKQLLKEYLTNRRDELIDNNRHDIAHELEVVLIEFSEFFEIPNQGEAAILREALEELRRMEFDHWGHSTYVSEFIDYTLSHYPPRREEDET